MDEYSATSQIKDIGKDIPVNMMKSDVFKEMERGVYAALETYSNVHRGSGHFSMVTTHLYEKARSIVLEYLGLKKGRYVVVFCTQRQAMMLSAQMKKEDYKILASKDFGFPLGVYALVVKKTAIPKGLPYQSGGGTTKLISTNWVIWADAPDRFEAGTPAIINIIAFARALLLIRKYGKDIFHVNTGQIMSASDILFKDDLELFSGQELHDRP